MRRTTKYIYIALSEEHFYRRKAFVRCSDCKRLVPQDEAREGWIKAGLNGPKRAKIRKPGEESRPVNSPMDSPGQERPGDTGRMCPVCGCSSFGQRPIHLWVYETTLFPDGLYDAYAPVFDDDFSDLEEDRKDEDMDDPGEGDDNE
jgi:hypothetical protein